MELALFAQEEQPFPPMDPALTVERTNNLLEENACAKMDSLIIQQKSAAFALIYPTASSSMESAQSVPTILFIMETMAALALKAEFFKDQSVLVNAKPMNFSMLMAIAILVEATNLSQMENASALKATL